MFRYREGASPQNFSKPSDLKREFILMLLWRHDTQHNDTHHNDIQHNDTKHKELIYDPQHKWHSAY